MSTFNAISPDKLFRLIGTSACPTLIDVRDNPTALVPGSQPRHHDELELWAGKVGGPAVVICKQGKDRAAGAAAWLRHVGVDAEILDGGFEAWVAEGLPVVDSTKLPPRDEEGRTRWVTRARPKVDRIACPWLIRRFVDPHAVFLFAAAPEMPSVSERLDA